MIKLLPKTDKTTLAAALVALVALSSYAALSCLFMLFRGGDFVLLVLSIFLIYIAVSLWQLSPVARTISLVCLWLQAIGSVSMPWNPIYYLEFQEKHHFIPPRFEVILQYWAIASVCLLFIYLLMKHKAEFQTKPL